MGEITSSSFSAHFHILAFLSYIPAISPFFSAHLHIVAFFVHPRNFPLFFCIVFAHFPITAAHWVDGCTPPTVTFAKKTEGEGVNLFCKKDISRNTLLRERIIYLAWVFYLRGGV